MEGSDNSYLNYKCVILGDYLDRRDAKYCLLFLCIWEVTEGEKLGFLRQDFIILEDHSRPHTANRTCDWLCPCGWKVMEHTPV